MIYSETEHSQHLEIEEINYLIYKVLSTGQSVMQIRDIHGKQKYGQKILSLLIQLVYLQVKGIPFQIVLFGVQQGYFIVF